MKAKSSELFSQAKIIQQENLYLNDVLKRFNTRVARFSNISPLSSNSFIKTPGESSKKYIKVKKELEALVNERKTIESERELSGGHKTVSQMCKIKSELEQRLKVLTEENEVLKKMQPGNWKKNEVDEVARLRENMKILEKEREEQAKLVKMINEPEFFEKCVKDQDLFEKLIEGRKVNEVKKLEKYLKILEKKVRTNRNKFAQEFKEMQELGEKLGRNKVYLQMKVLKLGQKQRLMEISERSLTPVQANSSSFSKIGFLFKPSINELYN